MEHRKVLIFVTEKANFKDFKTITEILGKEGVGLSILSLKKDLVDLGAFEIIPDLSLEDLRPENYDCLILMNREDDSRLIEVLKEFSGRGFIGAFGDAINTLEFCGISSSEKIVSGSKAELFALKVLEKLKEM
jgi:hypothetical protein